MLAIWSLHSQNTSTVVDSICCEITVKNNQLIFVQLEDIPEITAESTMDEMWASQMTSFIHHARATLRFAKKIPG